MKSLKIIASAFFLILSSFTFASISKSEKQFIKGSLADKISIINKAKAPELYYIAQKGLDFSIENAQLLEADKELTSLALASVNAFPASEESISSLSSSDLLQISEKFMAVFKLFKDNDLRLAVINRLSLYSEGNQSLTVNFLNDFLSSSFKNGEKASPVIEQAIIILGKCGDEESLSIIFNIWFSKIWPEYQSSTDNSLLSLSQDSFADVIKIISASDIENSSRFFKLLRNSSNISENFLCHVAENSLLIAINNAEKLKANGGDSAKHFTDFQLECHNVLTEHKWSHASSEIKSSVLLAKKAYEEGSMNESDFVTVIKSSVNVPSHELAQSLTDMLSECNDKVDSAALTGQNEMPARSVVLALITALGDLGDKTAFDTLLYVTYISYPLEVIDEAKASLAKLNW